MVILRFSNATEGFYVIAQAEINPHCISKKVIYSPLKLLIKKTSLASRGKNLHLYDAKIKLAQSANAWRIATLFSLVSVNLG